MALPSAKRQERCPRNPSSSGTEMPRLRASPPKGGSETKLKRISISARALPARGITAAAAGNSHTRLRRLAAPPACQGFPRCAEIRASHHPCTAFAATTAGKDRWTREQSGVFLSSTPPVLSRPRRAVPADTLIALYTSNSSTFCFEIRSQKELHCSKSGRKKSHRTAGNEQIEESVDNAVGTATTHPPKNMQRNSSHRSGSHL